MDDIIQKIMDIEKKAREIVDGARGEKRECEQAIQSEIDAFRENAGAENRNKIDAYKSRIKAETDEGIKQIEENARISIGRMEEISEKQKNEWVEHLFGMIIKGEI